MKIVKDFKLRISSDIDYEKLIAEVYYGNDLIVLINQESEGNLEIEFWEHRGIQKVPFDEFVHYLEYAKAELAK